MSAPAVGTAAQPLNPEHESIQAEREHDGRFAAGNRGGPGNPFARRVAELRSIMLGCITDDDFRELTYQLLERAKAGELPALKLLYAYVLGKPAPAVNPDDLDWQELGQR